MENGTRFIKKGLGSPLAAHSIRIRKEAPTDAKYLIMFVLPR